MKHVILNAEEQSRYEAYPPWCNLSWFQNCPYGQEAGGIVEAHYHDFVEIWLWHQSCADGVVDGQAVKMSPGVMAYNPVGSIHSYVFHGFHSNTGICPRRRPGARGGHLHVEETGENPYPDMPAIILMPERNNPAHPAILPKSAFLQNAYSGQFNKGKTVFKGKTKSWLAILVREGHLTGNVDGENVDLLEPMLLIVDQGATVKLKAETASDAAFAVGRPTE